MANRQGVRHHLGSWISALQIETRWRMPPLNSHGRATGHIHEMFQSMGLLPERTARPEAAKA